MGAAVALELAMTAPEWPRALVLCGDIAAEYDEGTSIEQLAAIAAGRARREFDSTGYAPNTPREIYQAAFGEWIKTDPRATVGDRRAMDGWAPDGRLSAVSVPVTIVVGEHTEEVAHSAAADVAERLPNATVVDLPGAGRRGVVEQSVALAAIVAETAS
jgi:pimeloyl-ACP methyl ester carboxylesterase